MPKKRLVLVLVDVDAERWEANAFVRWQTLERFVREAVEHKISCRTSISVSGVPACRDYTRMTITDERIRVLLESARSAGDVDTGRACYAALSTSEPAVSSWTKEAAIRHCAGAASMLARGAQECREMMARFVEQGGDPITAASIRANWNPAWGPDPGPPVPAPEPHRCMGERAH